MKIVDMLSPDRKVPPSVALIACVIIVVIDLLTPTQIILGSFFVVPVLLAAWFNSFRLALAISIALPLIRFFIATQAEFTTAPALSAVNAVDRLVLLSVVSFITSRLAQSVRYLKVEVKVLEGLIPICSNCKKIRDHNDVWQPLEEYIGEHSEAEFTHGICPECANLLYGKYMKNE
jgi:K+-sensing histidine kinase KdpD